MASPSPKALLATINTKTMRHIHVKLKQPTRNPAQPETARRLSNVIPTDLYISGDLKLPSRPYPSNAEDQYPKTPIGFQNHAHAKFYQIADSEFQGIVWAW